MRTIGLWGVDRFPPWARAVLVVGLLPALTAGCDDDRAATGNRSGAQIEAESPSASSFRVPAPRDRPFQALELREPLVIQLSAVAAETELELVADSGNYLQIVIEQHGVDVKAELRDPEGRRLLTTDRPTGSNGWERLDAVAAVDGLYRLTIWALTPGAAEGGVTAELTHRRPATVEDKTRAALAQGLEAAERELAEYGVESWQRARELYLEALRGVEPGDPETRVLIEGRLAWLAFRLGHTDESIERYSATIEEAERLGLVALELWLRNDSGSVYRQMGRIDDALATYQRAGFLARQVGDRREEVVTANNLALVQRARGKPWSARLLYQEALAGWRLLGDRQGEAVTLHNLGVTLLGLRQLPEAETALRRSFELLADEDLGGRAVTLTALGSVVARTEDAAAAERLLRQALALRRQAGDQRGEAVTLGELAALATASGDSPAAEASYRHALGVFRQHGDLASAAHTLLRLTELSVEQDREEQALELLDQAQELYDRLGDPEGTAEVQVHRARLHYHQGDPRRALGPLREALAIVEGVRLAARSPTLRAAYGATIHPYHELHLDLELALDRLDPEAGHARRAFEALEKVRARTLREKLVLHHTDPVFRPLEQLDLGRRIRALELDRQAARRHERPAFEVSAIDAELHRLLFEHEKIRTQASQATVDRRRAGSMDSTEPVSPQLLEGLEIEAIRRQVLDDESLLLVYALGSETSYLLALDRQSLSVYQLPDRATLERKVQELYRLLSGEPRRGARMPIRLLAESLGQQLLGPVAGRLGSRRLVLVPDGALHLLPWAVLGRPRVPPSSESEPLIVDHELVVAPSASVIAVLRARPRRNPTRGTLAVVADPVFAGDDPRFTAAGVGGSGAQGALADGSQRPVPAADTEPAVSARRSASGDRGPQGFERLVFARQEAQAILAMVPPAERLAVFDFSARRESMLGGSLADFRILHFATHGVLHEEPELSGLVLSLVDAAGQPQDGFVRAFEIAELRLANELVVLGTCRSALGERIAGEGMVGLPRSFLEAGASAVLVSLWDISDPATAVLMTHFYSALLEHGETPAAALRSAQRALRRDPRWDAPYYWAGFELQGDWR